MSGRADGLNDIFDNNVEVRKVLKAPETRTNAVYAIDSTIPHLELSLAGGTHIGYDNAGIGTHIILTGGEIQFKENNADIMVLKNSNIGIGTNNPQAKLHVMNPNVAKTDEGDEIARFSTNEGPVNFPLCLEIKSEGGGTSADRGIVLVSTEDGLGANFIAFGDLSSHTFEVDKDGNGYIGNTLGIGTNALPHSTLSIFGLPTSSAGLMSGDVWIDTTGGLNILKIVI